ncbi:hypothetical protein U1Q18_048475 [Sarracenia purpurea var. burkii]
MSCVFGRFVVNLRTKRARIYQLVEDDDKMQIIIERRRAENFAKLRAEVELGRRPSKEEDEKQFSETALNDRARLYVPGPTTQAHITPPPAPFQPLGASIGLWLSAVGSRLPPPSSFATIRVYGIQKSSHSVTVLCLCLAFDIVAYL